jgi:hypothetical protein
LKITFSTLRLFVFMLVAQANTDNSLSLPDRERKIVGRMTKQWANRFVEPLHGSLLNRQHGLEMVTVSSATKCFVPAVGTFVEHELYNWQVVVSDSSTKRVVPHARSQVVDTCCLMY